MNRSAAVIGIGVLAIAVIVGVILFFQLPSMDTPLDQASPTGAGVTGDRTTGTDESATTKAMPEAGERLADGSVVPSFDVVRVDKKGNIVIAGKAGADCVVTVSDGDRVVGTATADRRGDWVIVPGEPLAVGESQLTLSAKCGDADPVSASRVVVLIVPEREDQVSGTAQIVDAQPSLGTAGNSSASAGGQDGAGAPAAASGAMAIAIPRDASKPAEILQGSRVTGDGVAIDSVDYDEAGNVVITGTAPPGGSVQVYVDNALVGRANVGADGRWTLAPDKPVAKGAHTMRADLINPDGTVLARAEIPFVRGEALADLPAGRIVVIQPGDYLWKIARARYGEGTRYTLIYDANRAQIGNPDLIYPGQVFVVPRFN